MDERPRKRSKLDSEEHDCHLIQTTGHGYGNIYINGPGPVQLGDRNGPFKTSSPPTKPYDDADKYEILLKSLLFDRMDDRVNSVRRALSRTCEWLFEHKTFEEWHAARGINRHNGFLWIKGKPGCGKSTIMKTALERTQKEVQDRHVQQTVLHYFFNARAPTSLEKSSLGLYRSLTHQLLSLCPHIRPTFTKKFALKQPDSGNAWTKEELQDFLGDVVMSIEPSSLCIFIDALDEGEHEDDVRQLIGSLVDLSERALEPSSSCQLRICLSSRHYPHISIKKGLSLVVEEQLEHSRDIDTYISTKLVGSEDVDKDDLNAAIRRKSANIFLWVVLVVDILNKNNDQGSSIADMREQLDTIPSDLDKLFREILLKNDHGIDASIALLQWVLFAERPLKPQELYLATEYSRSPGDAKWSASRIPEVRSLDALSKYVLNCSRGLVELTPTQPPIVQFIHETVREFLTGKSGLASLLPALSTNLIGISHEILKTSCLRYISATEIPNDLREFEVVGYKTNNFFDSRMDRLRTERPFVLYAVTYVFSHAENSERHGVSQRSFLTSMLDKRGTWQSIEKSWWNVIQCFKTRKYAPNVTLLYFLADHGYEFLLSSLLQTRNDVNVSCGRYGNALQAACVNGDEQIVQRLLANRANVNAQGGEWKYPLLAAVMNKNFTLVPLLQRCGARLPLKFSNKALFAMITRKSMQGVSVALDLGADLYTSDDCDKDPLQAASCYGNKEVVQLLLDRGADINAQNYYFGNALQTASHQGKIEVVRLLLDRGADVNAQGGKYGNPLQAAAYAEETEIVQLLLDRGAHVNTQGGYFGNALQAACWRGEIEVVQLLLDRGADVNAQGGMYGNALQAASRYGKTEIVQLSHDPGLDVNTQCDHFGSALQAVFTNRGIVPLLLKRGANINEQGGYYGNALRAACYHCNEDMVRFLLESGADIKTVSESFETTQFTLDGRTRERIVQILKEYGAKW